MKQLFDKLEIKENRGWGVVALLIGFSGIGFIVAICALILWWEKFEREEKVNLLSLIITVILLILFCCIPFVGWVAAIVWIVFYIIKLIKLFKGDFGYKIPLAAQIAGKIAK